jgi:hypothetical protein
MPDMPQPIPPRYCPTLDPPRGRNFPGGAGRGAWHGRELPEDLLPPERWRESVAWLFAVDLWNGGFAWEAGEVAEGLWRKAKLADPLQARFLQGFIMLAGSRVHRVRNRETAEESLVRSGLLLLQAVRAEAGPVFMGVNIEAFMALVEAEQQGGAGAGETALIMLEPGTTAD